MIRKMGILTIKNGPLLRLRHVTHVATKRNKTRSNEKEEYKKCLRSGALAKCIFLAQNMSGLRRD